MSVGFRREMFGEKKCTTVTWPVASKGLRPVEKNRTKKEISEFAKLKVQQGENVLRNQKAD